MFDAVRRFLWSVPLLVALTIGLFALLTHLDTTRTELAAPRFFNPAPLSAQVAATLAVEDVLAGKAGGSERLVTLGGAALPTILENWPARPLPERRIIADAMWPVATRMGLVEDELWLNTVRRGSFPTRNASSDEQLLFWESYREQHAIDLNPLAAQRLVKRVASHDAQLRRRELRALDTFALPTLVAALGRVTQPTDVERCRRLLRYIAHATGQPFAIEQTASILEAQREVTRVRRFWDEVGPKWTQHTAFEQLVGRLVQTEYARWLVRSVRELTRMDRSTSTERLVQGMKKSAPLLMSCILGLLLIGPVLSSAIVVALLGARAYQFERFGLRIALASSLVIGGTWILHPPQGSVRSLVAIALFSGAAFGVFIFQRELSDRLDWRTHHLLRQRGRAARILAVARWIAPTIPTLLPMALLECCVWMMCLELTAHVEGVSALLRQAYHAGDWSMLMSSCVTLGVVTLCLQLVSDFALGNDRGKGES